VQEDAKPTHAVAVKEFWAVVEWLVPLSTPDPFTAHWMVNGLLAHAHSLATQEVFNNTFKVIVEFLLQSRRCRYFKDVFM
jgi:hypothetical protein